MFAQTLFGFELASADPRVVAINLVGEEDEHTAMTDYAEHMRMVGFLRELYPKVRVSLHAGELAPGLVPPEGLCCHIRLAVEQARTDRIGHGVDVMYEDRPYELLKNMADKGVLVEINLTSNDRHSRHRAASSIRSRPIADYGVPVALSTDDPGIARIDLTHEYVRAVETYGSELRRPQGTGAQQSRIQLPAGAEPVGRQRRLCALRGRMLERGSGSGPNRRRLAPRSSPQARKRPSNGSWSGAFGTSRRALIKGGG